MWEIEALMENTIRLIDKSNFEPSKKRNLIWNTYNLQNQFDCSFTHFRVMDILIKNEYAQQYNIDKFPMTTEYPVFFNELSNKDFAWIHEKPTEKWSETNHEIGCWDEKTKKIYVDFGSKYYSNHAKETVVEFKPLDFGFQIINEANTQKDSANVYNWTAFMTIYLLQLLPSEKTFEELKNNYFSKIKNIFHQFDYTDYKVLHRGLDLNGNVEADWLSEIQKKLIKYVIK